jgi:hypothetical protein
MKTLPELQQEFRSLNSALIEEYEQLVKQKTEEQAAFSRVNEERSKQRRTMLSNASFNTQEIDRLQHEDFQAFQKEMEVKRQEFTNRKSMLLDETQQKSFYSNLLQEGNKVVLNPFATSIMASDQKLVENIHGERGNPWVFPDNPSQIKIKDTGHIGGWTCGQAYAAPPPPVSNTYFHFTPNQTGKWDFSAIFAFHGFYFLKSDDSWWNCRSAWVKLSASVKVFQYTWQGAKSYSILNKTESNANYTKLFDSTQWLDTSAVLRAGDTAWILATITVEAMSLGSGTAAELNFQDGTGNYILPLFVSASAT